MAVKLFVLGLPGSGKSSVARYISMYAKDWRSSTMHVNDYDILYQMFQEDTQGQFRPAAYDGFDVLDLSVFDAALRQLEQKVKAYISGQKQDEIVLIEFSRNDYENAFKQFSREFLQDAYFLYLSVSIENCKSRIRERITHPTTLDDHFVSDYIFEAYYHEDDGLYLSHILEKYYWIDKQQVLVIDNDCSLEITSERIDFFIDSIIGSSWVLKSIADTPGMLVSV